MARRWWLPRRTICQRGYHRKLSDDLLEVFPDALPILQFVTTSHANRRQAELRIDHLTYWTQQRP